MLHSFTEEALQTLQSQGVKDASRGSSEMVRIIDDAHQQMKNQLKKLQGKPTAMRSNRSFGSRESPYHSDYDTEPEARTKKPEPGAMKYQHHEDMLILNIDHTAKDTLEQDLSESELQISDPIPKEPQSPTKIDMAQLKELEIIEEQNEQDNQSESGEASSLLEPKEVPGKKNPSIEITFAAP